MTRPDPSLMRRLVIVVASLAIFATACGGAGSAASEASAQAAVNNEGSLTLSSNIAETQLLDTNSGEITSLGDVVTGDRAVLAWYWAPH